MTDYLWWLSVPLVAGLFIGSRKLNQYVEHSFFKVLIDPVFVCIFSIGCLLIIFELPYQQFKQHTKILSWLLEPAIVALALPLYQQFKLIRSQILLILGCCSIGVINATCVAVILSAIFDVPAQLSASMSALSVTTPITLLVTESLGGIPSLGAAMVIFIGLLGALFGSLLLRLVKIHDNQAKGIAIGTACHAIGTAAVLNESHKAGAFASVAMALSALLSALIVPLLYPFLALALL